MNTVTLHFRAEGQKLTPLDGIYKYASNTVEYIRAVFDLGDNWTDFDVVRAAWFTDYDCIVTVLDQNGVCVVPAEVLNKRAEVCVNLFGCDVEEDELVDRLTTYPIKAILIDANARVCGSETAPVTPSQFEQFIAIVEQIVGTVKDIDHTELTDDYCLIIYYTDGTDSGKLGPIRGATGATGNGIASAVLNDDYTLTLNYTDGEHDTVGPIRGAQGETGNGIYRIELTNTSGAVKTYTILFTDGNTFEYNVTDGEVTFATLEQLMPKDTASGTIASFPDGQAVFPLMSCLVDIDPVQDLHGYDSPWVGGAGKNKFNKDALDSVSDYVDYYNNYFYSAPIYLKPNTAYTISPTSTASLGVSDYYVLYNNPDASDPTYLGGSGTVFAYPVEGGTPTTKHFTTGATGTIRFGVIQYGNPSAPKASALEAFMSINYQIEEGSSPTAWTPYSNICPITGWTGCEVDVAGVNLFDKTAVSVDKALDTTTGLEVLSNGYDVTDFIPVATGQTVFIPASGTIRRWFYDSSKSPKTFLNESGNQAFTPTEDGYIRVSINVLQYSIDTYQIEVGSTATAYKPYSATTYPVSWQTEAGTVYGGTVDLVTGVLTIDSAITQLSSLSWSARPGWGGYRSTSIATDVKRPPNTSTKLAGCYCETYKQTTAAAIGLNTLYQYAIDTDGAVLLRMDDGKTSSDITGAIVYPLANPITVQLTPEQIATLYGTNNIFADSGAVSVGYIADIGLYIDKKTS